MNPDLHSDPDGCDRRQPDQQVDQPACPLPHPDLPETDRPETDLPELDLPDITLYEFQFAHLTPNPTGDQTRLRTFLLGSTQAVRMEILRLHHSGYDVRLWSRPQAIPGTDEVISVYTKRSRRLDFE